MHRRRFQTHQEALDAIDTLPLGFEAVQESMAPAASLLVPIRNKDMKTEDIIRYDNAREFPFQVGETVYVPAWDTDGTVVGVHEFELTVKIGNLQNIMGVTDVIRTEAR